MPEQIRYHLDESVTTIIAVALRRRGIDVTTTAEVGLLSATDDQQLAHAAATGRVLITRDHDFLALASRGRSHAGIVYWSPNHRRLGEAVNLLILLWRTASAESMLGTIEFL